MTIWDTNICIYYLKDLIEDSIEKKLDEITDELTLSVITAIELLSWSMLSETEIKNISNFIDHNNSINLDNRIIKTSGRIRRSYGIKLPDAVIVATAIENNCVLVSRNDKDFKKIKGLQLFNPFD